MLNYCLDLIEKSRWFVSAPSISRPSFPFSASEAGLFYAGPRYFTERSEKDNYLLLFTLAGMGEVHTPRGDFELHTGQAALIDCMDYHLYRTASKKSWTFLWAHIDRNGVSCYAPLLFQDRNDAITLNDPERFTADFQALCYAIEQDVLFSHADISNRLSSMVTHLLSSYLFPEGHGGENPDIEQARKYIQLHCAEALTMDEVAKQFHFSKYHFIRLFKKQVGLPPYEYLIDCRIRLSKKLLCNTSESISAIAIQVGFSSESNFIHQFRTTVGITPGVFRKNSWNFSAD